MNLWILLVHIIALLVWAAAVLYLPILIAAESRKREQFVTLPEAMGSVARIVFCYIATPAAIIAIIAGTLVFVLHHSLSFWLMFKMTLVALLVILHASLGLLITRLERDETAYLPELSMAFFISLSCCFAGILWVVLAKIPTPEFLPWSF